MAAKVPENWQGNRSLVDCNKYMLENDIADITFKLTNAEDRSPVIVRCLKTLLIARSAVFYAMFCSDLQEKRQEIEVSDVEPEAFKALVRYMYTDEVDLTSDNVLAVLYASEKYGVSRLSDKCSDFLYRLLTPETAPMILEQSLLYNMEELITWSFEKVQYDAPDVLANKAFTKLSPDTFRLVIESEVMNAPELDVFIASLKWAKRQCKKKGQRATPKNLRDALGNLLFSIRFPTMTTDEFNDRVVPENILSEDEVSHIRRYLTSKRKPDNLPFITKPRAKWVVHLGRMHIKGVLVPPLPLFPAFPVFDTHGNREVTSELRCSLSHTARMKKLFVHVLDVKGEHLDIKGEHWDAKGEYRDAKGEHPESKAKGKHRVKLSIKQNDRVLISKEQECERTTTKLCRTMHYAVDTENIIVNCGNLDVNICVRNNGGHTGMFSTHKRIHQLSDGKITLAMEVEHVEHNMLLGIEYENI